MTLEPGRYQIRVGVRESVGSRVGTVFYDLLVPDFRSAPLMLSGVLITAGSAQSAMTALPDAAGPRMLPGPAVSRRTFARNDTVTVFAEIYDNSSSRQPRQIETAVTLIAESGQEVFRARDSLGNPSTPAGAGGDARRSTHGVTRDIPLKDVPSGRYLLRVEAGTRGSATPVVRETLITVR